MSRQPDTTDVVRAWLATVADELNDPDYGLDQIIDLIPTTPQRRRWWSDRWSTRGRGAMRSDDVHGDRGNRRSRRMYGLALLIGASIIGAAGLLAASQQAEGPRTIVVAQAGGGDFRSITEAVAQAQDGDTILVRPGKYVESVTIGRDINVRGDGDPSSIVVEGSGSKISDGTPYSILLSNTDATFSGMTIDGMPSTVVIQGGAPTVEHLVLQGTGVPFGSTLACADDRGCGISILVDGASRAVIRDNQLIDGADFDIRGHADPSSRGTYSAVVPSSTSRNQVMRPSCVTTASAEHTSTPSASTHPARCASKATPSRKPRHQASRWVTTRQPASTP